MVDPAKLGAITAFGLAPAASDERPIGEALMATDRHGACLADKGFTGVEWERLWMEVYGALVAATLKNNSRRSWSKEDRRWASGRQGRSLHSRAKDKRLPRPPAAPSGGPVDLAHCTSVV